MKNKTKFVSIVLFLSAFIMIVSHGNQKVEWKGKIEIEDGVKVIKNPKEPLYGEIKFELEEDLSIGEEDDDNYMFFGVGDIEVDSQENIYVADKRNYRIQKFDRNGNYVQTIGRQGQGPGEFELPTRIRINETTGDIYVKDLVSCLINNLNILNSCVIMSIIPKEDTHENRKTQKDHHSVQGRRGAPQVHCRLTLPSLWFGDPGANHHHGC